MRRSNWGKSPNLNPETSGIEKHIEMSDKDNSSPCRMTYFIDHIFVALGYLKESATHFLFQSPSVPKKLPNWRGYFSESACYLIKFIKGIYYTMPNLGLSICFVSVSERIDFL